MGTPRDLKVQMAAETRARERAQALAKLQTVRADKIEAALTEARAERDAWQARALAAEADLATLRRSATASADADGRPGRGSTGALP
ncbi:MAG: hypothetical protein Q7T93_02040 [Methylobacterium sp.]|uniref:hypothetical protein n=1 Tax=unclassified Methylobacterium TaxID=2615210 RepID=UPI0006F3BFF5|nr:MULTISPECIES: hypothetical protein [unclassified Methylobacterium]KQP06533.1 hypothetical protein ASF28_15795 [Methylobacterium sp. Leaf99]MDO9425588.1 hypothetical protein [Methylobacterium sp.]